MTFIPHTKMHWYARLSMLPVFLFLSEWAHWRSVHRLRESFLSLMIYRVSGLDEPPLDASPTPAPLAICQCLLQYTEPYVGSRASYAEAKPLPRHSGRTFSSLYISRIPLCHHVQWEYKWFVPVAIHCAWGVEVWIMWLPETVMHWSSPLLSYTQTLWLS